MQWCDLFQLAVDIPLRCSRKQKTLDHVQIVCRYFCNLLVRARPDGPHLCEQKALDCCGPAKENTSIRNMASIANYSLKTESCLVCTTNDLSVLLLDGPFQQKGMRTTCSPWSCTHTTEPKHKWRSFCPCWLPCLHSIGPKYMCPVEALEVVFGAPKSSCRYCDGDTRHTLTLDDSDSSGHETLTMPLFNRSLSCCISVHTESLFSAASDGDTGWWQAS